MADKVAPYIYPRVAVDTLGLAMATRLKEMLLQGSPQYGVDGLSHGPKFINRQGAGGGRDESYDVAAEVRFYDDGWGSIPAVMIVGIQANGNREEWGDDQWIISCTAALDCYANGAMPNGYTAEVDPNTANGVLGSKVWSMLDNYESMVAWGFTNANVAPNAPQGGAVNRDGSPFEFHFPLTVEFEVYVSRIGGDQITQ